MLQLVIVHEALVALLALPFLDEGRNEVYSRLICDDIARNKSACHSEAAEAELRGAFLIRIVTHEILSEVLHVVNVKSHVVAESVRLEQSGDAFVKHIVQIAAHDVQRSEILQHQLGDGQMNVPIGDSRLCQIERQLVAVADYLIDVPLLLGELAAGRQGTGEIRGVVHIILGTGVDHHQFARLDDLVVQMIVQSLTMLGKDCRERHAPTFAEGHTLHLADNLLLDDPDLDAVAGHSMHPLSESSGIINLLDLTLLLDKPHRDDSLHEFLGGVLAAVLVDRGDTGHILIGYSHKGGEFHRVVVAARRKEMNIPACGQSLSDGDVQRTVRC